MNTNTWNYPIKTKNQPSNVQNLLLPNYRNAPVYSNGGINEWVYNKNNPMVEVLMNHYYTGFAMNLVGYYG
ncbi:hypothetical protein [Arsenophonus endosymbiont of Aleurodicus floccissimus]|uniref:hypothetical protein n=1 Tax=Arsenophonus endosymbiont of Aleurodicus floccissimus TaxID=2152761 RepID=UPI000E6AF309|nr:hypothetical protein [Arsenophonus endosymbiont of Aleurodicus floccissimus]